jgi:ribosome-binding protein aMBF1 (putative translation factor)
MLYIGIDMTKQKLRPAKNSATSSTKKQVATPRATEKRTYRTTKPEIKRAYFVEAMERAHINQEKIAQAWGVNPALVSRTFSGKRKLQMSEAVKLASLLSRPLDEILANAGVKVAGTRVSASELALTGVVDGALMIQRGAIGGSRRAPNPMPGLSGLQVVRMQTAGTPYDSMDGGLVYFQELTGPIGADVVGRLCVVKLRGDRGEALRVVKRGYTPGSFNLHLMNGQMSDESAELETASPVIWMKL